MGRRSDHSRDELFEMALNAAEKIVEKEGITSLTARRVSKEIGYSVGTIYNLFDNLDDLSLHVKARTLDALYAVIKDTVQGKDVTEDFLALSGAYFQFLTENPNTWGSILERVSADGKALPNWYLEKVAMPFSVVERALMPLFVGQADAQEKAEYAAHTLWCGVHGIAVLGMEKSLEAMGSKDAKAMADYMILTFLKGLKHS
ncbi:TetR/AcrR family transcriptional regulator [Kordiimonas pumila]|uniref:TetR/AcrR family transcriptional regulator n=1 Tax=Kordiimonas pumila TaxID=2161677 RepID=A0ABV7D4D2_9PROT|nr:WHG domain-containing protein [Kordiimonas pumila]